MKVMTVKNLINLLGLLWTKINLELKIMKQLIMAILDIIILII